MDAPVGNGSSIAAPEAGWPPPATHSLTDDVQNVLESSRSLAGTLEACRAWQLGAPIAKKQTPVCVNKRASGNCKKATWSATSLAVSRGSHWVSIRRVGCQLPIEIAEWRWPAPRDR